MELDWVRKRAGKKKKNPKKTPLDKERFFFFLNSYSRQISEKNLTGLACSHKAIILLWERGPQGRFRLTKIGSREWKIDRDRMDNPLGKGILLSEKWGNDLGQTKNDICTKYLYVNVHYTLVHTFYYFYLMCICTCESVLRL